eukprot:g3614.t1
MSSRRTSGGGRRSLYPGWGSGKRPYETVLKCRSMAYVGKYDSNIECGDKLILPQEAFRDVSRLKLPFPIIFEIQNMRRLSKSSSKSPQLCGVYEFSAEKGYAYVPSWMMKNLGLRENSKIKLQSKFDVPKGELVKLQPHSSSFVEIAANLGPQYLLEDAMRHYCSLSRNETIKIKVGNDTHMIDIVEVQPGPSIQLYGDLDLKVEFAPPLDTPEGAASRVASQESAASTPRARSKKSESRTRKPSSSSSKETSSKTKRMPLAEKKRLEKKAALKSERSPAKTPSSMVKPKTKLPSSSTDTAKKSSTTTPSSLQSKTESSSSQAEMVTTQSRSSRWNRGNVGRRLSDGMVQERLTTGSFSGEATGADVSTTRETDSSKGDEEPENKFKGPGRRLSSSAAPEPEVEPKKEEEPEKEKTDDGDIPAGRKLSDINEKNEGKLCKICMTRVPIANFEMHSLRCARTKAYRKQRCELCETLVLAKNMEKHLAEECEFRAVTCPDCNLSMCFKDMKTHIAYECLERWVQCEYCKIRVKAAEYTDHKEQCGTRTTRCDKCKDFIMLKDFAAHQAIDCIAEKKRKKEEQRIAKMMKKQEADDALKAAEIAMEAELVEIAKRRSITDVVESKEEVNDITEAVETTITPSSSQTSKEKVNQFKALTGCDDRGAKFYLETAGWDVNVAVSTYFDANSNSPKTRTTTTHRSSNSGNRPLRRTVRGSGHSAAAQLRNNRNNSSSMSTSNTTRTTRTNRISSSSRSTATKQRSTRTSSTSQQRPTRDRKSSSTIPKRLPLSQKQQVARLPNGRRQEAAKPTRQHPKSRHLVSTVNNRSKK